MAKILTGAMLPALLLFRIKVPMPPLTMYNAPCLLSKLQATTTVSNTTPAMVVLGPVKAHIHPDLTPLIHHPSNLLERPGTNKMLETISNSQLISTDAKHLLVLVYPVVGRLVPVAITIKARGLVRMMTVSRLEYGKAETEL